MFDSNKSYIKSFFYGLGIIILSFVLIQTRLGESQSDVRWLKYLSLILYTINEGLFLLFLRQVIIIIYKYYKNANGKIYDNFVIGINYISLLIVILLAFFNLLLAFGISPKTVLTSLSIVAAAIVIVTKEYMSNMITGIILMFSNELSINDQIATHRHRGKIINITLQNVQLLNDDDNLVFIPNQVFLVEEVINYTKRRTKRVSIDFEIAHSRVENVEELEKFLMEELGKNDEEEIIKKNSPALKIAEIKGDLLLVRFQYILNKHNMDFEKKARRAILRAVVNYGKNAC